MFTCTPLKFSFNKKKERTNCLNVLVFLQMRVRPYADGEELQKQ